ncbi:DUF7537 family lipoprotein [Halomarina rubra]|uniref:Lipoprotein n=1 Tax=Halomarina rubra TaxID=2071873 RepID=A0ABD6AYL5_9EURY|nr:hypothetical protein [Halomarina rubra]
MRKSPTLALLLCATLVLAGCSAVPGLGGGSSEAYTSPDEPLNASALQADHTENVEAADSFTYHANSSGTTNLGQESNGSYTVDTTLTAWVDVTDDEYRYVSRTNGSVLGTPSRSNVSVFITDGTAYAQQQAGGETQYDSRPTNLSSDIVASATLAQQWAVVDATNWTQDGTETVDGETLTRYVANGSAAVEHSALLARSGAPESAANVADFDAVLLVTSDGTVRSFTTETTIDLAGRSVKSRSSVGVSDLDDTSVERPDWLDRARNASSA